MINKNFSVEKETERVIQWIKDYFDAQPHARGAILGLSGGKDSATCAALLVKALGKDRVMGISLPNGIQKDMKDAILIASILDIDYTIVNIGPMFKDFETEINKTMNKFGYQFDTLSEQATINMLPRIRMTVLYAISAHNHYRVCGTGNLSEATVGYFTKWGDGAHDFNPIANFTTEEVVAIGKYLGMPEAVMDKPPSDGICGKTDEDNLGISYDDINKYLNDITIAPEVEAAIVKKMLYNKHKSDPIPTYSPINI